MLPTLITLSALACGLSSVVSAIDGYFWKAYWFLFASAIFDGLDGHAARALKATSALGAELDSLCDLVDFGVSPAFVILMWSRHTGTEATVWYESDATIWLTFLFYVSCCAFRLARFNLDDKIPAPQPPHSSNFAVLDEPEGEPKLEKKNSLRAMLRDNQEPATPLTPSKTWLDQYINRAKFFQGIPAPAAALVTLSPMVYWMQFHDAPIEGQLLPVRAVVSLSFFVVGCLMICQLRTFSSKMLIRGAVRATDPTTSHLRSRSHLTRFGKIAAALTFLATYVSYPYIVHMGAVSVYLITLPVSHLVYEHLLTDPAKQK